MTKISSLPTPDHGIMLLGASEPTPPTIRAEKVAGAGFVGLRAAHGLCNPAPRACTPVAVIITPTRIRSRLTPTRKPTFPLFPPGARPLRPARRAARQGCPGTAAAPAPRLSPPSVKPAAGLPAPSAWVARGAFVPAPPAGPASGAPRHQDRGQRARPGPASPVLSSGT